MLEGLVSQPITLRTEVGDEQLDLVEFEARARRGEISPQSLVKLPAVTGDRFMRACELELYNALHEPRQAYFSRAFSLVRFPWMTAAIIFFNLAAFLYTADGGELDIDDMVRFGAKVGPLITDLGEVWRLLTANFLHRNALHLGLNMFVLFNVGGVLENTYRTLDYLWLLVFSGLATTAASLFFSEAISLGASGMVYGCLGGVVLFGIKYRSILPIRYRRIIAEAAIPTVLGLLLIGFTSRGVDNWAHLGGLLAGLLTGAFMRPRLLLGPGPKWGPAVRALPSGVVLVFLVFGQNLLAQKVPQLKRETDDTFGLSVLVPQDWRPGASPAGTWAFYNGLPGLGRATFAADALQMEEGADAVFQAQRYVEQLEPRAVGPEVLKVRSNPPVAVRVSERDAMKVRASFDEPVSSTEVAAFFIPRGEWVYQLVFHYPAEFPRYEHVVEQMVNGIRFHEPKALRQARAQALLFPNAPQGLGELGYWLRREGEAYLAAETLRAAVKLDIDNAALRRELARAWLQAGEVDQGCEASAEALLFGPDDAESFEVQARCDLARGRPHEALRRLDQAHAAAPQDESVERARFKLRTELERGESRTP